jgi:ABC-type oligopeptide transport system substrate-binding subunit
MARIRIIAVIWLLVGMLAGCASNDPATPTAARPTREVGGGGNFILTMGDDPPTLDPALVSDVTSALVVRQLFSGLVKMDNRLEVVPDMAASWDISPDERTYTFHLRPDITFADGTPISADDIQWSLERATDPATGSIVSPTYLDDIAGVLEKVSGQASSLSGVKAIDAQTVEITLREPSTLFLTKLANPTSFIVDRRAAAKGGDWFEQPNGSGPFKIAKWDRRRRLELVPNERYYGTPAKLGRVTFLLGAEGANSLGLYEDGDIDYTEIGAYDLDRINDPADPLHSELRITPQMTLSYVAFNTAEPPFDDPLVREAFVLLIDRVKLAEVSADNTSEVARGILPPGLPGAKPADLPEPRADIARAKQLLADSSYGGADKLPPIIGYTQGSGVGLLAQIAKDELGVEIELRSQERFGDFLTVLNSDSFNLYDFGWVGDYPDPQNFLEVLFGANGQYNFTNYKNPRLDELLAQAKAERDETKRGELYRQAEKLLLDEHVVLPISHSTDYSLVKTYVQGLEITPLGILDLSTVSLRRQ